MCPRAGLGALCQAVSAAVRRVPSAGRGSGSLRPAVRLCTGNVRERCTGGAVS